MNAIMPDGTSQDVLRGNTLHSLLLIFFSYLEKVGKLFELHL